MASYRLEMMGKVMGLSEEEIEKAIPVKEANILCLCRVKDARIIQTHLKLERVADAEGIIVGAIGKCPNCGKVYYLYL